MVSLHISIKSIFIGQLASVASAPQWFIQVLGNIILAAIFHKPGIINMENKNKSFVWQQALLMPNCIQHSTYVFVFGRWRTLRSSTLWTSQKCPISTRCTSCTTRAPSCSFSGKATTVSNWENHFQTYCKQFHEGTNAWRSVFFRNKHIMIDLGTGNNNKINWTMEDKQEMIDIVETVYRGARKGRGLVVSPKDYSTKYRYWSPSWIFFFLTFFFPDKLCLKNQTGQYSCSFTCVTLHICFYCF